MNTHILLLFLLAVFIISAKWYISICRQTLFITNKIVEDAFFPIYIFNSIGFLVFFLTCPKTDMTLNLHWSFALIPCVFPLFIFLSQAYCTSFRKWGLTYLISLASVFLLPKDFLLFSGFMPLFADRLVLSLILYTYTNNFYLLNTFKGTSGAQMLLISIGAFALYLYGALPQATGYLGLVQTCVLIPFMIFSLNTLSLRFTPYGCNTLGFIYGWFSLWMASEGMAESSLILSSWFVYELLIAYARKLTFMDRYRKIEYNTFLYGLKIQGYTHSFVLRSYIKTFVFLLLFACLQVTSFSRSSFLIFTFAVLVWTNYKINNPSSNKKTLKETNAEFIKELKEEYSNFKKQITPIAKKEKQSSGTKSKNSNKNKTTKTRSKKAVSTKSQKRK